MVEAYHLIFTTYGFWLPNDPRGSGSDFVRREALRVYGEATKVTTRTSVANRPHDFGLRQEAKSALTYAPVHFDGLQARSALTGFGKYVRKSGLVVWAGAIMPDHVHMVVRRFRYRAESIVSLLKQNATRQLIKEGRHPFQDVRAANGDRPSCWGRRFRKVFLNTEDDIRRAIRYVENNPVRAGKKPQHWSFIAPFVGRSPHA